MAKLRCNGYDSSIKWHLGQLAGEVVFFRDISNLTIAVLGRHVFNIVIQFIGSNALSTYTLV